MIFRATPQWFISMERKKLREHTLRDIKGVQWTPAWGEQRIAGMIETRPDWCVSRQRTWGVPIPLFVHKHTGELHPRTQELILEVAARVEVGGIDAWFALSAAGAARGRGRQLRQGHRRHGRLGGLGDVVRVRGHRASGSRGPG